MDPGDTNLYADFTNLKFQYPGIQTWISVGGWTFHDATNHPNTQTAFSDMASTPENRKESISSLVNFMQTYGFDGLSSLPFSSSPMIVESRQIPPESARFADHLQELTSIGNIPAPQTVEATSPTQQISFTSFKR
jgi:hypothetical protein